MKKKEIILCVGKEENKEKIKAICEELNIETLISEENIKETDLVLKIDEKGIFLMYDNMTMQGDFSKMIKRIKQNNLQSEMLVKAAKIKGKKEDLVAIDATAGLGEDSFLLAAAGFTVHLYESNPVIAVLLEDALERAKKDMSISEIASRMILHKEDSTTNMKKLEITPDVVVLDPMFPARNKSSLIKKKFQILHQLEFPCSNEKEMIESAISMKPHKVVIKRPAKASYLNDVKPSYSLNGNSIRYDCIVIA